MSILGTGKRYNGNKLRYDLVNPEAMEGMVEILTMGADKYGDRNWEKGMAWSICLASMKRHIAAFERGEDFDIDCNCPDCKSSTPDNWTCKNHSGKLHIDHIQCNAHFLAAYYRIFPQGDNRYRTQLPKPKIGLDIDEVLCDWVGGWINYFSMDVPQSWFFDKDIMQRFASMRKAGQLDHFYLGLLPKIKPEDIPFEPHCYVTSRPVSTEVTTKWLEENGFPMRPVYTIETGESKVEAIKKAGIDIFIDDRYENFEELNRHGICCFLMDTPHNQRYDVGFKRLYSLKDLKL